MDGQPDRSRFLSSSAVMDTATPSPLFTDLARHTAGLVPSCTAADSSLHSRYIQASLPLGSGKEAHKGRQNEKDKLEGYTQDLLQDSLACISALAQEQAITYDYINTSLMPKLGRAS